VTRISILGASGHVGRSLTYTFSKAPDTELHLFSRKSSKTFAPYIKSHVKSSSFIHNFTDFGSIETDIVINCIGVADPGAIADHGSKIVGLTEEWDERIVSYLEQHPRSLYISISSGVVYDMPHQINSDARDYHYATAKYESELRHREHRNLNIADIRLFGYFSRFQDINGSYLLSQAMLAVRDEVVFETLESDLIRDFVTPTDLCQMIYCCFNRRPVNRAYDMFTRQPVSKYKLLDRLKSEFGLEWKFTENKLITRGAAEKSEYFAHERDATWIGYRPKYSAIEGVVKEFRLALESAKATGIQSS
jgi:nucleoside-diphosphate-sugar epimerase